MTDPSHFQQLLQVAASQAEPHRLLFVFTASELPDDATPTQRARFLAGEGGALAPLMCVDKAPDELRDFEALLQESRLAGPPWQVVFAAALGGAGGQPPSQAQVESALQAMVQAVHDGGVGRFAAFGPNGDPLTFQ
jgi:hypothetical protein